MILDSLQKLGLQCTVVAQQEIIKKKYNEIFKQEILYENTGQNILLTDQLTTDIDKLNREKNEIEKYLITLKIDVLQKKCNITATKGVKNTIKAIFSRIKYKLNYEENDKCGDYYYFTDRIKAIDKSIDSITTEMKSAIDKKGEGPFIGSFIAGLIESFGKLTELKNDSCSIDNKNNNRLTFKSFDGLFKAIKDKRGKTDLSKYNKISHMAIQNVIGFATFLPIDLKELLAYILGIKEKRRDAFDLLYEIYRTEIYQDFTSWPYENYYLRARDKSGIFIDPPYDKKNDSGERIPSGLFPPSSLLEKIKINKDKFSSS
jgi:hypothetical protein